MRPPRIALLNAASAEHVADTTRNFRDSVDATLVDFRVATQHEIPTHHKFEAVIITGSKYSVYDDRPWIDSLQDYVAEALDQDVPVLGVCFGHQVLAEVLDGTVEHMGEYELGYHNITQTNPSPLFKGISDVFVSFITHQDAVTELPPGATQLAQTDVSNHSFKKGTAYGVQFHPEFTPEVAQQVVEDKEVTPETEQRARASLSEENYEQAELSRNVFNNFLTHYVPDTIE